tara:strand:- start:480 stop:671 length:192 start_codon:yes stop_codon:yes gene_type:complete
MKVKDAKPKDVIQIESAGSYDPDSALYLVTSYQDLANKVRAIKELGGGIVHLYPDNNCRVINN